MSTPEARIYRFEGWRVDTRTRQLHGPAGAVVPLNARAFDSLLLLLRNRDRLVGKDEFLDTVWAGRVVEENTLTQAISQLRRALGTGVGDHRYILTVPGRGYRFVAEVQEEDPAAPAAAEAVTQTVAQSVASQAPTSARRPALVLGALLFLLALFAVAAWRLREAPAQVAPHSQTALAVLPFRALSQAPEDPWLELGLAETLITRLGHSPDLRVRALGSSQRALGPQRDVLSAGRQLGAAYVVDGSTQRIGERVRVNARLLSVERGDAVWAGTFDARIERAFELQDQIAAAVVTALAARPLVRDAHDLAGCNGADAAAYRAWLKAQYKLHRREPDSIAAFRDAIALDPSCARAYAGLSTGYLSMVHADRDPRQLFPLARAAAEQALRIDPGSAEALMAQGRNLQLGAWDWPGAEAALRQSLEINPSLAETHFALAHLLTDVGRHREALSHARQARELDPLSPLINALEGGFLTAAGQPDEARRRLDDALELEPDFWIARLVRGGMALDRGDTTAAVDELSRASARSRRNSQVLAVLATAQAAAGDRAAAQAIQGELAARAESAYVPPLSQAAVQLALGDRAGALDLLERGYREHDIRMAFLAVDARWNPLRSEPRFRALLQRLRLPDRPASGRF